MKHHYIATLPWKLSFKATQFEIPWEQDGQLSPKGFVWTILDDGVQRVWKPFQKAESRVNRLCSKQCWIMTMKTWTAIIVFFGSFGNAAQCLIIYIQIQIWRLTFLWYTCLCWIESFMNHTIILWLFAFTSVQLPLKAPQKLPFPFFTGAKILVIFQRTTSRMFGDGKSFRRRAEEMAVFGECFSKAFSLKWDSIWAMEKHGWFIGYY